MLQVTNISTENHNNVHTYIMLSDGYRFYTVPATLYNAVQLQVEEIIPALDRDEIYTLEELCGKEFWDSLTAGEPSMAGRCMAHMVVNNLLPLSFADYKHEYAKRYRLRQ